MTGVPLRIYRDGQFETVYLGTPRTGEHAVALRARKDAFYAATGRHQSALKLTMALASSKALEACRDAEAMVALSARQDEAIANARAAEREALQAAEDAVRIALTFCQGPDEAARILDCLNDSQILACMPIMSGAEQPEDFFGSAGAVIRSGANGTGPGSATSPASSAPAPVEFPASDEEDDTGANWRPSPT